MLHISSLLDLSHSAAGPYLMQFDYPWQALPGIRDLILSLGTCLGTDYREIAPQVWVHETARVAPTAFLGGPAIIGPETEVRHCAFIRETALVGRGCVVGNSTELKNVILFDGVQVPHYNYVGDSILGYKAHMGAGAVTSNVKSDKSPVAIRGAEQIYPTGLKKMGAILGDGAEIGCNSVLNPGAVIGRNSIVYPTSSVRGFVPENCIYKAEGRVVHRT